jgi:hypothetical protein
MAGEIQIRTMLTTKVVGEIMSCGLDLQIQVDCSHNAHVKTMRSDRPGQPIISKPIELDTQLKAISDAKKLGEAVGKLQSGRSTSAIFSLYQSLTKLAGGVSALAQRNIKIEFPNFDTTIVNLAIPPAGIADAIQACQAADIATFNALPEHVRQSMGMYLRVDAHTFQLVGNREPGPRTAVP